MAGFTAPAEREIEMAISNTQTRILRLQSELEALRAWEGELQTSLRVIRRLADTDNPSPLHSSSILLQPPPPPSSHSAAPVGRPPVVAKGKAALAGEALTNMLKAKGDYIKPMEAVNRLRSEHGLVIGSAKPGRETSDLSAAIGHGKVPGLIVTRRDGWGLKDWNGKVPGPGPISKFTVPLDDTPEDMSVPDTGEGEPPFEDEDWGSWGTPDEP